jgi:hypothetical protein
VKGFFSRVFGLGNDKVLPPPAPAPPPGQGAPASSQGDAAVQDLKTQDAKKKKGFFGKLAGIFKDDKPSNPPSKPPDNDGDNPH